MLIRINAVHIFINRDNGQDGKVEQFSADVLAVKFIDVTQVDHNVSVSGQFGHNLLV